MRWQRRCRGQGCHSITNGTLPLVWQAGVCFGKAVQHSQLRVLRDDRTVRQRCDTGEHHPSTTASPCLVVTAGVSASVAGARDASGDDHARHCGQPSPPAPLPRCGQPSPPALSRAAGGPHPRPSPALREALTPGPSPALRERGDLERIAPAPLTSPFSPRMRAEGGRGVGAGAPSPLPLPQRGSGRGG